MHEDLFIFKKMQRQLIPIPQRIRQVVSMLSYDKPQILEVFKNTLSSFLYWVFFPIKKLREAVETTKRII